jgi:glucose-6-phosphate isomerase
MVLASSTSEWRALEAHAVEIKKTHLRDLLQDTDRNAALVAAYEDILMDFSRERVTPRTMDLLFDLAEARGVRSKIKAMFSGEKINSTEGRAVLHVALRAPRDHVINLDGENQVPKVWAVLDKIKAFSEIVRR